MALNWPGLLQWSTKYHDGTAPSNFKVMSPEDRAFLEKAMEEAFGDIEDPNKVMTEAIEKIQAEDRTDESISTALEVLDRICDDVDVARNIEKLDGLQPLLDLVRDYQGPIRNRGLEILALLFSNNPSIQEAGVKRGALALFIRQTQEGSVGSEDRSKAFRALVALIRGLTPFETLFLRKENGIALLVDLMQSAEDSKTREKAASFIVSVACNGEVLAAEDAQALAPSLAGMISDEGDRGVQFREVTANCALELAKLAPAACGPILESVVQARLAKCESADEIERGALQECAEVLSKGKA